MYYGFGLMYVGSGSGNLNSLRLRADNQNGTEVTAIGIDQAGNVGIGADGSTGYKLYVNGKGYFAGKLYCGDTSYGLTSTNTDALTVGGCIRVTGQSGTSSTGSSLRRIYFGDGTLAYVGEHYNSTESPSYDRDSLELYGSNGIYAESTLMITPKGASHNNEYTYDSGGYYSVNKPNIMLFGDPSLGLSTIQFISQKGRTSINKPSDAAFIQFNPYGVTTNTTASSTTAPTIKSAATDEINRLIIGVTNDSNDQVWLQTPAEDGLRHVVGKDNYRILTSYNTYVSDGVGYINGTTVKRLDEDESIIYGANNLQYLNISLTNIRGTASTNGTPTNDWYHIIRMNHGNSAGYFVDIATCFHSWNLWYRRIVSGAVADNSTTNSGWVRILDSKNTYISGSTIYINDSSIAVGSGGSTFTFKRTHATGVPGSTTNRYIAGFDGTSSTTTTSTITLYSYGGVYYNGTGVYYTSDKRIKYNIKNILNSDVDKLFKTDNGLVHSFFWKGTKSKSFGFIAQELKEYCPEAVDFNTDDNLFHVNYNVAFAKIIGAMFKKIKEQDKIIKDLEKKVNKK